MVLNIEEKAASSCGKYKFHIYNHKLSYVELDEYILQVIYDADKLNYLFQPHKSLTDNDRVLQLQRFIETDFCNREEEVTNEEIWQYINNNNNESYYSFFAEALLARLNIDYIDKKLVTGVINIGDNLTKVATGADVCMFSEENLVLGEAKFYSSFSQGLRKVINDESINSKLNDFIKQVMSANTVIILKNIEGSVSHKSASEIRSFPLILSGFVLHNKNKTNNYNRTYKSVNSISLVNFPEKYKIHLYHLPIESKEELIFKAQRSALDLIIKEKGL